MRFVKPQIVRRSAERRGARAHAYTLVEVLIVVAILGIAGAMVAPAFSQTGVLRTQAAVRTIVSDITTAQSDALALQTGRAIQFSITNGSYKIAEVRGTTVDWDLDLLSEQIIRGETYGNTQITGANFGSANTLYFDELGSPESGPMSGLPASTGQLTIAGSGQIFRISVESYTGRVTVTSVAPPPPGP